VTSKRGFFRNPKSSMALILGIVATLVIVSFAGVIGAELYARHLANSKVANAVQCEVQDSASVSFAATPPVLWQYLTHHYTNISVQTAGNQVRDAKGMKVDLNIHDIKLSNADNSKGTIGSLNGTITWSSDGIKESIQNAIPVIGSFVTGSVTTNPSDGTISLKGLLDSATLKPQIVNNGLSLQVVSLSALGSKMSTDKVQKNLDDLTAKATQNYPLGIHADSVKVTDSGVGATFSTQNATIPASSSQPQTGQDCFSGV
jgi:LmeA-like phospholipid-binding